MTYSVGYLNVSDVSLTSERRIKVLSYDVAAGGCRIRGVPGNLVIGACSCSCSSHVLGFFFYNIKGPASLVIWATMAAGRAEKLVALA